MSGFDAFPIRLLVSALFVLGFAGASGVLMCNGVLQLNGDEYHDQAVGILSVAGTMLALVLPGSGLIWDLTLRTQERIEDRRRQVEAASSNEPTSTTLRSWETIVSEVLSSAHAVRVAAPLTFVAFLLALIASMGVPATARPFVRGFLVGGASGAILAAGYWFGLPAVRFLRLERAEFFRQGLKAEIKDKRD